VSEFETLEEYKEDLKTQIADRKKRENDAARENAVVEAVAAAAEVEIPEAMVGSEVENMMRDFDNRLRQQGMNLEMYTSFSGQTAEDLREQMKSDAEKRVLNNLVLEAIAKEEGIAASEEDVEKELQSMADMYKRSIDEIRSILGANGSLASLNDEIALRKTIEFLLENSKEVAASAE